jgi:phage-related protein
MRHQKLKILVKTRFANKAIMFEESYQFENDIILCYGRKHSIVFQQKIPKAQVWAIIEVIAYTLNLVVLAHCVMNQSKGHWSLLDALTTNITHTMEMEATLLGLSIKSKISNPFEAKILLLHMNMLLEVIKAIKKNWSF